jgi:hydroxymethylbilane synthase
VVAQHQLVLWRYNEEEDTIHFQGVLFSLDGKEKLKLKKLFLSKNGKIRFLSAQEVLNNGGGTKLMAEIKNNLKK